MSEIAVINPELLITKAVENQVPVETMERLLAMRKDLKEEQAKEAFYKSLSEFQSKCPVIKKTKEVRNTKTGGVRYRFAPLDAIIEQVGPLLKDVGLSYTFYTKASEGAVTVVCEASHILGFTKPSEVKIDIDPDAFMNQAQKSGSALTYAKRYSFCNAFGILTGDDDDDGQSAVGNELDANTLYKRFSFHMKTVLANIGTVTAIKESLAVDDYQSAAEALAEIDEKHVLDGLRMAPTKGGCFTVDESNKMKGKEFQEYYKQFREGREMTGV